jgi:Flp pilus assembly protein TadG
MNLFVRYWRDQLGAGAAEFAIVVIPFTAMIFGIIHLSLLFYANQTLQFAAEAAARCYSVDSVNCATTGAVQTYAAGRYTGPNISPSFVASGVGCGHTVTGTGNYQLNAVFVNVSVPLSVSACFP